MHRISHSGIPAMAGLFLCLLSSGCDRSDTDRGAFLTAPALAASTAVETGLDFPSNLSGQDTRFRFTGPALLPMFPATYIWRSNHRNQAGHYGCFFWGPDEAFYGVNYYGPRPYPDGPNNYTSTTHKWSIAAYGSDPVNDAYGHSTQVTYGTWRTQAFRAFDNGSTKVLEFFWELPDTTKVIRYLVPRNYGNNPPSNSALTFGAAPGAPASQRYSGILRGIQVYASKLALADLLAETGSPLSTAAGSAGIWYLNPNPAPDDIADRSGKNHHPAWVGQGRPALWTGGQAPAAPTVSLAANPSTVASGQSATLTWSSANATGCAAGNGWSGSKALSGSETTAPLAASTTFTLTCTGAGGSTSQSATVTVSTTPPPPAPTVTLAANPAAVASGSASTLTWSSSNATSCNAGGSWTGTKAVSGSQSTGALSATATYTLTCTGAGGSASASATVTVNEPPPPGGQTGLDFPSNGSGGNDVRFRFRGANLNPMYPATYVWRVNLRRQAGYYTTFFWGPDGNFTGTGYYGAHPYPDGDAKTTSTSHKWEVSVYGNDFVNDANGHSTQLGYDVWRTQAFRAYDNGVSKMHEFYWDLPDTTKVIRVAIERNYGPPSNPALTFGTAPWSPGYEHLSGILRGVQIYSGLLTMTDVLGEIASPKGTSAGNASIWYLNLNPTPADISDKSGKGHHPEWVTSLRPGLWTGP